MSVERVKTLDYLRGLMAFSILLIHFRTWILVDNSTQPAPIFGSLIIYGVVVFFILSGATMFLVYRSSLTLSAASISSFAIKRIFRIFPLLWLLSSLKPFFTTKSYTFMDYFLTYSGLFGFVDVTKGIARLSWSIGVELVFYSLFPLLIFLLLKKNKLYFYVLYTIAFFILCLFAFYRIDSTKTIVTEGSKYVNPLNHIFLFMSGLILAYHQESLTKIPQRILNIFLIGIILIMAFFPIGADLITIMSGPVRILFCFLSIIMCGIFMVSKWHFPPLLDTILTYLGEKSYSIYLLHPLSFDILTSLRKVVYFPNWLFYFSAVILSLILSHFVFKLLEMPMIKVGKKLSKYAEEKMSGNTLASK